MTPFFPAKFTRAPQRRTELGFAASPRSVAILAAVAGVQKKHRCHRQVVDHEVLRVDRRCGKLGGLVGLFKLRKNVSFFVV